MSLTASNLNWFFLSHLLPLGLPLFYSRSACPSLSLSIRDNLTNFLNFMGHISYQCDKLLGDKEMITFLQTERYDITILDAFNPCSFILAHKLGTFAVHVTFVYLMSHHLNLNIPTVIYYLPNTLPLTLFVDLRCI